MSTKTAWIEAARGEVKHNDPMHHLQKNWGDWSINPFYDSADVQPGLTIQKQAVPHKAANGWYNLPLVYALLDDSNLLAISHLNKGADGVMFRLSATSKPQTLLADIKPEFCFIGFEAGIDSLLFFESIESILQPRDKVYGAIFWSDNVPWLSIARIFQGYSNFRCFGIHVGTLSEANIEIAIQKAIHLLDELTDNAFNAQHVLPKLAFSVQATPNFFLDVAMIRSLKILFQRLVQAYGVENVPAFVRLVTQPLASSSYDPHGAMISDSLSALSGVSASVDTITIVTENQNSNLHLHTARSVSLLLKEESKLDKVVDPLAGSYFIESLTNTITEKVWTKLKNS